MTTIQKNKKTGEDRQGGDPVLKPSQNTGTVFASLLTFPPLDSNPRMIHPGFFFYWRGQWWIFSWIPSGFFFEPLPVDIEFLELLFPSEDSLRFLRGSPRFFKVLRRISEGSSKHSLRLLCLWSIEYWVVWLPFEDFSVLIGILRIEYDSVRILYGSLIAFKDCWWNFPRFFGFLGSFIGARKRRYWILCMFPLSSSFF